MQDEFGVSPVRWLRAPVLEYFLELPCEPRRRFGTEGLLDRLRVVERLEDPFRLGPGVVDAARQATFDLRPYSFHCTRCPANLRDREFSCQGRVELPLSADAESWLMAQLPVRVRGKKLSPEAQERGRRAVALAELLAAREIRGRGLEAERPLGALVESPKGVRRRWGLPLAGVSISSSQLLEALFLSDQLDPELVETLLRGLGFWLDGEPGPDGSPEVVFTQPEEERDLPAVRELKRYLLAALVACSLDLPLRTRLLGLDGDDPGAE